MAHEFKSNVKLPASTTSVPSLNVPHGTAPTTPTDGDIWTTTSGIYARVNGSTNQLDASGGSYLPLTGGTLSGNLYVTQTTANSFVSVRADSGYSSGMDMGTGSSSRWSFQRTNEAESTGDLGSNFGILAFNDSGAYIDAPLSIARKASGDITLHRPTYVNASISTEEALRIRVTDAHSANAFRIYNVSGTAYVTINSSGKTTLNASTTTRASFNIPAGTAPTTPTNGDVWTTTAGLYTYVNGNTMQTAIFIGTSAPSSPVEGMLWLDTT